MTHQKETTFENIMGKGEIARNEQFLLFPQCFLLHQIIVSPFVHSFDTTSLFAAELQEPKIGTSGKGLKESHGEKGGYWVAFLIQVVICSKWSL